MLRTVLLLVLGLAVTISAWNPPTSVHYVSQFHSSDPNVDERYRHMITNAEARHRTQYEGEVSRRVDDENRKQSTIQRSIDDARAITNGLLQQQARLSAEIHSIRTNSEKELARQRLLALRRKFQHKSDLLRHNLQLEEQLDTKYRDERRMLRKSAEMLKEKRKQQAADFQKRLEKDLQDDKEREQKEKEAKEKAAEEKKAKDAQDKEAKEKAALEEVAAQARRQKEEADRRQKEEEAASALKAKEELERRNQENQVLQETQQETQTMEQEDQAEEQENDNILKQEKEFEEKEAQKVQEERIADQQEEEKAKQQRDKLEVAAKAAAVTAKTAVLAEAKAEGGADAESKVSLAGGATFLELHGRARGRCQISVSSTSSSSSGDEPTVDGLNSKGECQIGPKIQPTIEELYPILPELHKRPQEEFHENDYMDTRKVQLPEMDGKLSVDLQVFSSSEKLLQHAHNEHLTFTEQNKKTCGKPICEPKVDHFAGYP